MSANACEISPDPLVRCQNVVVAAGDDKILHGIDLALAAGEFVAIVGPSGAGKSTLLNTLSGEISPRQGTVEVAGRPLKSWTARQLATRRAVLPQSSTLSFGFPVVDVVRMGRMPYGSGASDGPGGDGDRQALQALARAKVIHLAHRNYATLSGGERQRVQFARVLAQVGLARRDGRYLLLDEPTASLDVAHAWQILAVARSLTRQKVAVVCVLHDLNLAASFADRILVMAQGKIVCRGRPRQVLTASAIETHFGIAVDVIDHPSRDAPLVAVRAP